MVTIKDVAKQAGVSISTVSNALNETSYVKKETKAKVMEVVQALNYFPNPNARLLKKTVTQSIGLFLPNINTDYYVTIIRGMHAACLRAGYSLTINVSANYSSKQLLATILSSNIDGAVIMNEHFSDADISFLAENHIPCVFLDKEIHMEHISSIIANNQLGINQAIEYLKHLGHKNIVYIRGLDNFDGNERTYYFEKSIKRNGMNYDKDMTIDGFFDKSVTYSAVRHALPHLLTNLPDAFFCANDEMALGCIRALQDLYINVPEDISVMGFDDIVSEVSPVPITTIKINVERIGLRAATELIALINHEGAGKTIRIDTELVVRKSCKDKFGINV